jgi:polyhydroxybutyrate depolymerase
MRDKKKDDQGKSMTWTIDGVQREALVFVPTVEPQGEKHPVILAFHGHGGHMQTTADQMEFQTIWPEAVVVYPQGLDTPPAVPRPHAGRAPGWQLVPGDEGDRDLKFFDRMLDTMRQKFAVDNRRIYAAGFSIGAIFAYVLWAKRGTTLAALGTVAGRLWPPTALTSPLPVMQIVGLADPLVTLVWQAETIEADRKINNAPLEQGEPCGDCCVLFPSSVDAPVKALFHTGGHIYPPWASAEFVKFFKAHTRT